MEQIVLRVAGIIAALGTITAAVLWVMKIVRDFGNGIKCLLRKDMMDTYYSSREDEKLREYEKKNFLYEYEAYKALKGNSFIDRIHEEVKEWEIVT